MFLVAIVIVVVLLVLFDPHIVALVVTACMVASSITMALHPPHEYRGGFRKAYNVLLSGSSWNPVGRGEFVLQTAVLTLLWPIGIWFSVLILLAATVFYLGDDLWTHRYHRLPGRWTADLALAVSSVTLTLRWEELAGAWMKSPEWVVVAAAAGLTLLAGSWAVGYLRAY